MGTFFDFGGPSFSLSAQFHDGWEGGAKIWQRHWRDSAPVAPSAYGIICLGWSSLRSICLCRVAWPFSFVGGLLCRFLRVRSICQNERKLFLRPSPRRVLFVGLCNWLTFLSKSRAVGVRSMFAGCGVFVCRGEEGGVTRSIPVNIALSGPSLCYSATSDLSKPLPIPFSL